MRGRSALLLGVSLILAVGWETPCRADDTGAGTSKDKLKLRGAEAIEGEAHSPWYFFFGNMTNFPNLHDASKQIDSQITKPLKLLAPGFDAPKSFSNQRNDVMIHTPFVGLVRELNSHWDLFVQSGYTQGKVRTKDTDLSILLAPLYTNITFKRSSFFAGVGTHWHPWGTCTMTQYDSWAARLRAAKPFFATSINWNYLTFDADIKAGFVPFRKAIRITKSDTFEIWSHNAVFGVDVPLDKKTLFAFNVNYNTFFEHGADFSGPSFSTYIKRYF